MGIIDTLTRPFTRSAPTPQKKGLVLSGFDLGYPMRNGLTKSLQEFSSQVEEGYSKNALVFRCVGEYASRFPEAPFVVRRADTDEIVAKHPIHAALGNVDMSPSEVRKYLITYLAIGGNAYLYKLRSRAGRMVGVFPMHAGEIKPVPSKSTDNGLVSHYWHYGNGHRTRVEKADVIHLRWATINPKQPWLGMAPLEVLGEAVGLYNEARRFTHALLANDAVPRSILKTSVEQDIVGKDRESIRDEFEEQYGGSGRGGLLVLHPGAEFQRIGLDVGELALDALLQSTEAAICLAFGVQPGLVGAKVGLQYSTFSNRKQDREAFYQDRLGPLWKTIGDEINQGLAAEIGEQYRIEINGRRIIQRMEDQDGKYLRVISAYTSGLLDEEEARDELGFDPRVGERAPDPDLEPDLGDEDDPLQGDDSEKGAGGRFDPVPFS